MMHDTVGKSDDMEEIKMAFRSGELRLDFTVIQHPPFQSF